MCCGLQPHLQYQCDVRGCVFKCWVGELFLGKVFQRGDATMEQGTSWLVFQLDESSPVFSGSQTQLNAPNHTPRRMNFSNYNHIKAICSLEESNFCFTKPQDGTT